MQKSRPRILLISSANPTVGPGVVAANVYDAFKKQGYEVDLLTLHKCNDRPEFLYVRNRRSILDRVKKRLYYIISVVVLKAFNKRIFPKLEYRFFYTTENRPPVPVKDVLKCINRQYDLVHIVFWQEMLSFMTVLEIYRKLKCQIVFSTVDYSPMSGGCHFTGSCERYRTGCGCCPAFDSNDPNDFTRQNVLYREKVYKEVNPIVTGNSYMFDYYDKSFLLKDVDRDMTYTIIDTDTFKPLDVNAGRAKFKIGNDKKFIILIGCQSLDDERKGVKYLVEAINKFTSSLNETERSSIQIVAIGSKFERLQPSILNHIDSIGLGYVAINALPEIYSMASLYLCSSVNDAGPIMVNQALCCGTPVVGFEMGTCIDSVKGNGTGYCAKLKDSNDLANGIDYIYHLSKDEYEQLSLRCRDFAVQTYSGQAVVNRMVETYKTRI